MINIGNCGLIIRGHKLNFDEIENNLKINPSRAVKKGEVISKVVGESEYDLWVYEMKMDDTKKIDQILRDLLSIISPRKAYIQSIAKYADVRIKCYVQSDDAQIYFELSPNAINELASLGIRLEISILSWGGVAP